MLGKQLSPEAKRQRRVRTRLQQVSARLRLSVFRSHHYLYGQIIDDSQGKTLVAIGPEDLGKMETGKTKIEQAAKLGKLLAQKALKHKIKQVKFDRGGYKYHGRVKALAQGARAGGLVF